MSATKVRQFLPHAQHQLLTRAVLIFSNTVRLLKMINEFIVANCEFWYLAAALSLVSGFDHNLLTGEVDGNRRQEMVDAFQDPEQDHYILLVSTLAGGVGLNLTAVSPAL